MRRLLYIILFVVLAASASAQVKVTGRVTDLQNKPVGDVIVKIVSGTKTLAYSTTNTRGEYSVELKEAPKGEVSLTFSHISYEKESENLTLTEKQTKVDMALTPKTISLKEVMVKADPLRQKGRSDRIFAPAGEEAHRDLRLAVDETVAHKVSVEIFYGYDIPVLELSAELSDLVVIDPQAARFDRAALSFFQDGRRVDGQVLPAVYIVIICVKR